MQHLTTDQLLFELDRRAGLIPTVFERGTSKLLWIDLETYHPYEGFFHRAVARFAALKQSRHGSASIAEFVTDSNVLADSRILTDPIYPSGFIFHAGRCGSTLLARILARDRRHLVFGEAAAHNQVWLELTNNGAVAPEITEENKQIYKHLILAMGRKRLAEHQAHFIKFTSFNILFFDFIRAVFPDVPAIFLYREPHDVLASYDKNPPAWFDLSQKPLRRLLAKAAGDEAADAFDSAANVVAAFFAAGLRAGEQGAKYLNYAALKRENLPAILEAQQISTTNKQLATMQSQFSFDSKVDQRATVYLAGAQPSDLGAAGLERLADLEGLYNHLVNSEFNVVPGVSGSEDPR